MMEKDIQGGGNMLSYPHFIVRRTAAIGDALCASCVVDKLVEFGYEVEYQAHPLTHPVLKWQPNLSVIAAPKGFAHVNLDGAYEKNPYRRTKHFHEMFLEAAQAALGTYGVTIAKTNARPVLKLDQQTQEIVLAKFNAYAKPWTFFVPRSDMYVVRQVPDGFWSELAKLVSGTCFWLGRYPAPPGVVDLHPSRLDDLVAWLSAADLLVSVDTGPAHIALALGNPAVVLGQSSSPELHFSDQRDFVTVWPAGDLDCLNCQENKCPKSRYSPPCQNFDPDTVARVVHSKLTTDISALIPTYHADAHRLQKAIDNVKHQVDEVIITCAADAVLPNIVQSDKVRVVRSSRPNLGFGRNVNFGMRHTSGQWVLLLNDDCYLNGDCVEKLKALRSPTVGMIAHLLRYPNGQIYFAGRHRHNGQRGFPHIDHKSYIPTLQEVTEMEAVSGTSVLINRKAFYEVGGFDERFFLYAEDDDISMRMRQAGYKLLYHPTALGVHEGSATTKHTHDIQALIHQSGALMEQLWGSYWDRNKNRVPGVFK